MFVVMDGENLFDKKIDFAYFEVAAYIARLIPPRQWQNEKLNLYERMMAASPAYIIQKQCLKEFM